MSDERVSPEVVEARRRWVEALESGEYEQARARLRIGVRFCCLGVACDVIDPDRWALRPSPEFPDAYGWAGERAVLPPEVRLALGLRSDHGVEFGNKGTSLVGLNDSGVPFSEIAAVLREAFGADLDRVVS